MLLKTNKEGIYIKEIDFNDSSQRQQFKTRCLERLDRFRNLDDTKPFGRLVQVKTDQYGIQSSEVLEGITDTNLLATLKKHAIYSERQAFIEADDTVDMSEGHCIVLPNIEARKKNTELANFVLAPNPLRNTDGSVR